MNEPSESTHYQVELTSRQVLTALVVLLICLFASFFAGVWIGRNAEADQAALEMARVDPVTGAGERFDFFGRTKAPGEGAEATGADADTSSSAFDDSELGAEEPLDENAFGPDPDDEELESADIAESGASADRDALFEDDPESELAPPEEMGRGGRRRRAKAKANETADDPAESAAEPAAAPASQPPPSPATAPPAPTAPPARPAARDESGFFIQVLATADRDKAETLIERLVDADFNAFLAPSQEGGRTIYRVRVGPFSDRALATRQAAELKSRWGLDSWIPPGAP